MAQRPRSRDGRPWPLHGRFEFPALDRHVGAGEIRCSIRREGDIINLEMIQMTEAWCESRRDINDNAGPEAHENFVSQLTPGDMRVVVATLSRTFGIGKILERDDPNAYSDLCRALDSFLYLAARGNITYDPPAGAWGFEKPAVAPPTPEMQERIIARIHADRELQFEVLRKITGLEIPEPPAGVTRQ